MVRLYFIIFYFIILLRQIIAFENLFQNVGTWDGLVSPQIVNATIGEDVFLKIIDSPTNLKDCLFRKSGQTDSRPPRDNVEKWSSQSCGIRIKRIRKSDGGVWRLTAKNDTKTIRGISIINVRDEVEIPGNRLHPYSPETNVAPPSTTYCYVVRPNGRQIDLPQHSNCTLPKLYDELDAIGRWNVISGIEGRTEETKYTIEVYTTRGVADEIETVIHTDADGLSMKCKILKTMKTIKFCRFLRMNDEEGFNLIPGRGSKKYRYYGDGFDKHECGITIENPQNADKSHWKCLIGVEEMGVRSTIGAILDSTKSHDTRFDIDVEDVYGLHYSQVNILCRANFPSEYCWFRHASGKKISVSSHIPQQDNIQGQYKYFGNGIKLGECGITIMNATVNDTGTWSCHMGTTSKSGVEQSKDVNVRISESHLVATSLFQDFTSGTPGILECRAVVSHIPVKYCRFNLPDGTGFSIDETVTEKNPLLNNFYFNPNRDMKSGYCSIIAKRMTRRYIGEWTCAALLAGRSHESWDDFRVNVFENDLSAAEISGMVFGIIFVAVAIIGVGVLTHRRGYWGVRRGSDTDSREEFGMQ